jgi:hypothetical protein
VASSKLLHLYPSNSFVGFPSIILLISTLALTPFGHKDEGKKKSLQDIPFFYKLLKPSSRNTSASSSKETTLASKKKSIPINDLQYCVARMGQKNL